MSGERRSLSQVLFGNRPDGHERGDIDRTYDHLAPDAEEYERGLLDAWDKQQRGYGRRRKMSRERAPNTSFQKEGVLPPGGAGRRRGRGR
jgi:hypothetical protein